MTQRVLGARTRPFLVVFSVLLLPGLLAANGTHKASTEDEPPFRPIRRPVLGLILSQQGEGPLHRLSSSRGKMLVQGSLEECERTLVEELESRHGRGNVNWPLPTFGGRQFWADVFFSAGWRIQQHVLTDHYRLLDDEDHRRAWGSHEACRTVFEKERLARSLRPKHSRMVILLHGMGRSRHCFAALEDALVKKGFDVAALGYPSTRRSISEHAQQIESLLNAMETTTSISFVTHSLGGIVARELLAREGEWKKRIRPHRLVMLGPPNQGNAIAESLKSTLAFRTLLGESGQELTPDAVQKIPPPPVPFGIIAGGYGTERGLNPFLEGDDDGLVTVEDTKLSGMADHLVVRCPHTTLMESREVIDATVRFLLNGRFAEEPESKLSD